MQVKVIGEVRDAESVEPEVIEPEVVDGEEEAQKSVYDSLDPELQKEILGVQLEIEQWMIMDNLAMYEIGRLLARAKEKLPHGTFQRWIQETWKNCLPYSTAASYLRVFKAFEGHPIMVQRLPRHYLQLMAQERFPGELL